MTIDIYPEPLPLVHRCRVHVPDGGGRHPILYLLHGVDDCEDDWDDVSKRKGSLSQWLRPDFPMYVVLPYCKPRRFPGGRRLDYQGPFPDADQFVEYFEQGLVESLRLRYPNADWGRQAIGGISMGGLLAFEIATGRAARKIPFRCIGLFSAALQSAAELMGKIKELEAAPPRLLYQRRQTEDIPAIINSNNELIKTLGQPQWLDQTNPQGRHNWAAWRPQLQAFLGMLPARL